MAVTVTTVGLGIDDDANRIIDRDPNSGRLWTVRTSAGTAAFWYSDNNGANWSQATGSLTDSLGAVTLFVDLDGGLNVAYTLTAGPGYRRGVVSGTTITWSSVFNLPTEVSQITDIVAFRNPTGGWFAAVAGRPGSGDENYPWIAAVRIVGTTVTSGGSHLVTPQQETAGIHFGGGVDFHHTGDGKTVQGGTPHLYATSKSGTSAVVARFPWNGSGYSFNNFGWGTGALTGAAAHMFPMIFDGTRIMFLDFDNTADTITLYERDAGNTATVTKATSPTITGLSTLPEMSYDRDGNIYIVIVSASDSDLWRNVWTRATNTWGTWTVEQAATATAVRLRRGWHTGPSGFPTVEAVYTDATNLIYQEVTVVNATPNAPTVLTPVDGSTQDVAASLGIIWTFNDPDLGDTQSAYTVRKRIGAGAHTYWNGTTWAASESGATKIASAVTSLAVGSGWGADGDSDHHYSVKTWDALDQLSAWSAEHRVVPSGKDNPTITIPVSDGTVMDSATETVEWTVATQTKYRLRVVGDIGGTPDLSVVDYDSGIKIGSAVRLDTVLFPTNGADRQIELTTWNDEGLQSTLVYRLVDVSYTPPAVATVTLATDSVVPGAIVVTISNTGTGAVEDHNDIFRREVGDTGTGIRIAANVDVSGAITDYAVASGVDYEYQAKTYATSGAISVSVWQP